jgi:hypothetical protein
MHLRGASCAAAAWALCWIARASDASADPIDRCAAAYEQAQELRLDGKLRAAREQLVVCSQPTCPKAAVVDCARWLAEVDAELPTLVLSVVGPAGEPLTGARVRIDGEPAATGAVLVVDPGPHVLYAEAPGYIPSESRVVLPARERRPVVLALAALSPPSELAPAAPSASSPAPPASRGLAAPLLGAAGLTALAAASYFWLEGLSARGDVASCAPRCDPTFYDGRASTARTDFAIGDVLGVVGVAALGVSAWLFFGAKGPAAVAAWRFGP